MPDSPLTETAFARRLARTAYRYAQGVRAAAEMAPDAVLADVGSDDLGGDEYAAVLQDFPTRPTLVAVTRFHGDAMRAWCRTVGFDHLLLKPAPPHDLLALLGRQGAAGVPAPPEAPTDTAPDDPKLSGREAEAVRLIALGHSNKEIAWQMRLSVKTVETYKARGFEKLGIRSRVELIRYASRQGWLTGL